VPPLSLLHSLDLSSICFIAGLVVDIYGWNCKQLERSKLWRLSSLPELLLFGTISDTLRKLRLVQSLPVAVAQIQQDRHPPQSPSRLQQLLSTPRPISIPQLKDTLRTSWILQPLRQQTSENPNHLCPQIRVLHGLSLRRINSSNTSKAPAIYLHLPPWLRSPRHHLLNCGMPSSYDLVYHKTKLRARRSYMISVEPENVCLSLLQ